MSAGYICFFTKPSIDADSLPLPIVAQLHTSFKPVLSSSQAYGIHITCLQEKSISRCGLDPICNYWNSYSPLDSSGRKIRIAKDHDKKLKAMLTSCVNFCNVNSRWSSASFAFSMRMRSHFDALQTVKVCVARKVKIVALQNMLY